MASLIPILDVDQERRDVVEEEMKNFQREEGILDISRMSQKQILEVMMRATDELIRRKQSDDNDPRQIFMDQLLTVSRSNTQSMILLLKDAAEQLGVEKSLIRQADSQNPRVVKRLLDKTCEKLQWAWEKAKKEITFERAMNISLLYRFGLTPQLIYAFTMGSKLPGLMGWVSGSVAFGLTGRFLYVNPSILEMLSKLQNITEDDISKNINVFVLASALRSALTEEIGHFLQTFPYSPALADEFQTFTPFILSGLGYIGWASDMLKWMFHSKTKGSDISASFARYVEDRWAVFTSVLNTTSAWFDEKYKNTVRRAQKFYEDTKKTIEHIKDTVKSAVQSGIDNTAQFILQTGEKVEKLASSVMDSLQQSLKTVTNVLTNVQENVGKGVQYMIDAPRKLEEFKQEMLALTKEMLGKGVQFIIDSDYRQKVLNRAMEFSADMLRATKQGIQETKGYLSGMFDSIKNKVWGKAEKAIENTELKVRELEQAADRQSDLLELGQPRGILPENLFLAHQGPTPLQLLGTRSHRKRERFTDSLS